MLASTQPFTFISGRAGVNKDTQNPWCFIRLSDGLEGHQFNLQEGAQVNVNQFSRGQRVYVEFDLQKYREDSKLVIKSMDNFSE